MMRTRVDTDNSARSTGAGELLVAVRNRVYWLTLSRPDASNAMNAAVVAAIQRVLDEIEDAGDIRCVVITGNGDAFCSGADLKQAGKLDSGSVEVAEQFIENVNSMMNRLENFPIPVIAALNGITLGAGLELALCADFIVATASARIGDGHARFGLLPGGGATARLPRRIGVAAAKWLSLTGDLFAAKDLTDCGLLQGVYADDEFADSVEELSQKIASRSPLGLRRMKTMINNSLLKSLDEALADEREMLRLHRSSWDRSEGLAAFAAKRRPEFRGN
jgi:enoyl-CoA hydratase